MSHHNIGVKDKPLDGTGPMDTHDSYDGRGLPLQLIDKAIGSVTSYADDASGS